jgi:hypothetical protein
VAAALRQVPADQAAELVRERVRALEKVVDAARGFDRALPRPRHAAADPGANVNQLLDGSLLDPAHPAGGAYVGACPRAGEPGSHRAGRWWQ